MFTGRIPHLQPQKAEKASHSPCFTIKLLKCVAHHCVAPADLQRFNSDFPSVVLARLAEEPMKHPALTYRWFAHRVRSRRLGFTHERRWEGLQRLGFLGVPA